MDAQARGAKLALLATAAMAVALVVRGLFDLPWLGLVVVGLLVAVLIGVEFAVWGRTAVYILGAVAIIIVIGGLATDWR